MNYTFALVGNPNVGKTSLYNRLTDSSDHVGNWHGVTVEKTGKKAVTNKEINIIDLPGLYSLTISSFEEEISRDDILSNNNDLIINICEANNLARNLYLTLQLLELNVPTMIVVNMMDEFSKRGKKLDTEKMKRFFSVPVFSVSAKYGFNRSGLLEAGCDYVAKFKKNTAELPYLKKLPLNEVREIIFDNIIKSGLESQYACIKVLENDKYVIEKLNLSARQIEKIKRLGDYESQIARLRYEYIDTVIADVIANDNEIKGNINKFFASFTEKVDIFVLNKFLALPIFLLIMSGIFWITFGFMGKFLSDLLNNGKDMLIEASLTIVSNRVPEWMGALLAYGIIDGVGSVIIFLPQVVMLFFFLTLLEDSGYISRVAFMTDGFFRKIGLSGRAAFTMIMGFGCSATAVMTARGLEDELMRKKTVILTPFISCSARLPVYTAIAASFFTAGSVPLIFFLYLLSVIVVIFLAAIFEKSPLKSGEAAFIMEMPSYRMPTAQRILQIIGHNAKTFLIKIGTIVFTLNVIVWILGNFSLTKGFVAIGSGDSIMENIGAIISPVFSPLGFGNWKAVTALISGLVAKEVVISTIASFGGAEAIFVDSLAAICFLVYTLLYVPCLATLGAIRREVGVKWMLFGLTLQLSVAYLVALAVRIVGLAFSGGILNGIATLLIVLGVFFIIAIATQHIFKGRRCVRCAGVCDKCR